MPSYRGHRPGCIKCDLIVRSGEVEALDLGATRTTARRAPLRSSHRRIVRKRIEQGGWPMRGYTIRCAFCFCEVIPHDFNEFTFYCPACDRPIFPWHTEMGGRDGGFDIGQSGHACPEPTPTHKDLKTDLKLAKEIECGFFLEFRELPGGVADQVPSWIHQAFWGVPASNAVGLVPRTQRHVGTRNTTGHMADR